MGWKTTPPPLCKPGYFCLTCPYPRCIRPGYGSCNNVTQEETYMLSLVGMARIGNQRKKKSRALRRPAKPKI